MFETSSPLILFAIITYQAAAAAIAESKTTAKATRTIFFMRFLLRRFKTLEFFKKLEREYAEDEPETRELPELLPEYEEA